MYEKIGKITWVSPIETIGGKFKEKLVFVITDDRGKQLAFLLFGEDIKKLSSFELQDSVNVFFTIKSALYKGEYQTSCFASRIEKIVYKQKTNNKDNSKGDRGYNNSYRWNNHKQQDNTQNKQEDWFKGCYNKLEAKARYKELMKKYHPDLGGDTVIAQQINIQYDRWR